MTIILEASSVESELPNGGVVRLPLGAGQITLVKVIRVEKKIISKLKEIKKKH